MLRREPLSEPLRFLLDQHRPDANDDARAP
jgi:hypothetical protein